MKRLAERAGRCAAGVILMLLLGPVTAHAQGEQITNLRLPLEHFESGQIKTMVTAGRATVTEGGDEIQAEEVRIEVFREDGTVESVVEALDCTFDRNKGYAESQNAVRMERDGIVVSGMGFEWHADGQLVTIHNNARVVLDRAVRFGVSRDDEGKKIR